MCRWDSLTWGQDCPWSGVSSPGSSGMALAVHRPSMKRPRPTQRSIMEGAAFVHTGIDLLYTKFSSLHIKLLPELPSVDMKNDLSTIFIFHTVLLWIKNSFHSERSRAPAHGIRWSHHVTYHHEAAGLIGQWNGLLKTQLQHQIGSKTLQGWGKYLQKSVYALHPGS